MKLIWFIENRRESTTNIKHHFENSEPADTVSSHEQENATLAG
jgi:hypothetical protein